MASKTANDIIGRSLRLIRVLGVDDTASTSELADGLSALQTMLLSWAAMPHMADDDHALPVFVDGGSNVTVDDALVEALETNLALQIAPEYGAEIDAYVASRARASLRNWRRRIVVVPELPNQLARMGDETFYGP